MWRKKANYHSPVWHHILRKCVLGLRLLSYSAETPNLEFRNVVDTRWYQYKQITWQISSISLLPVVSKSQATYWGNGILQPFLMFSFWFQSFHWPSHLIVAWLKGLFTCAHLNTRHLWKSKQRYQSMPFTSIPLLAEITLKRGLECYRFSVGDITFHHVLV